MITSKFFHTKLETKLAAPDVMFVGLQSLFQKKNCARYSGMIEVRINPAKKDGTRSNREFVLLSMEIDSIKKID